MRYLIERAKQQMAMGKNAQTVEVSEEELRELLQKNDMDDGLDHVKISKILGGSILIGDKLYKIKDDK